MICIFMVHRTCIPKSCTSLKGPSPLSLTIRLHRTLRSSAAVSAKVSGNRGLRLSSSRRPAWPARTSIDPQLRSNPSPWQCRVLILWLHHEQSTRVDQQGQWPSDGWSAAGVNLRPHKLFRQIRPPCKHKVTHIGVCRTLFSDFSRTFALSIESPDLVFTADLDWRRRDPYHAPSVSGDSAQLIDH